VRARILSEDTGIGECPSAAEITSNSMGCVRWNRN
jgi:hypothetical protein